MGHVLRLSWTTAMPDQPPRRLYLVEHHDHGAIRRLGTLADVAPHHTSLEPFLGELLRRGATGEVCLVDVTTETVVARRKVRPFARSKPWERFRQVGD